MIKENQKLGEIPSSKEFYSSFLQIAWPSALEAVLVSIVGSIDTIMVGGLGETAITAVGITNQPKFILLAAIFSLNIGITAIVARRKGQGDRDGANNCLKQGILLCGIISLAMALLGYIFAEEILVFAGASKDYLQDAIAYFEIILVSIVFQALNLTINAAQRGVGNTKIAMYTNVISNFVNIVFNYLLINGIGFFPRLGVRGAAIATAMGAAVACFISFSTLLKKDGFLTIRSKDKWGFKKDTLQLIGNISGNAMIEQVFMRVGFFAYNIIVAKIGTTEYAVHLICMNILNLSFSFGDGFGIAASSLVGQSLGEKRPDKSIIYGKIGQRVAFIISSILFLFYMFGRRFLVSLFSSDPVIINMGASILIIVSFITHLQTSQVVISGCLRGAGDTKFVAIVSLISIGVFRPFLTWLLCYPLGLGLMGAWISVLADQTIRLLFNFYRFSSGKWTTIII
ncbi:MAG: MATE family efflux transporter [Clostridiales bacterium]|nr:MATE family efflux transporter [Clostridiales bacterium]